MAHHEVLEAVAPIVSPPSLVLHTWFLMRHVVDNLGRDGEVALVVGFLNGLPWLLPAPLILSYTAYLSPGLGRYEDGERCWKRQSPHL